jgi:peptidoglycan hydrolase CwlO-like protein
MSEAITTKEAKAGRNWLDITKRVLVALLMVLAVVALIVNLAGLVGTWVGRAPAYSEVTDVTATLTQALERVDNGLTRVNTRVQDAQQTVTQINNEVAILGNQIQANSPVVSRISQLVDSRLGPGIDNVRSTASDIRDAVVAFNSLQVVLKRLPVTTPPRLDNALSSVSQYAQQAQAAVQDLRVTLEGIRGGLVTRAEAAITLVTAKINAALKQIEGIVNKYQTKVTNTHTRVTDASNKLLLLMNVTAVSLTILFIIFALGLLLLINFCWQYVRNARFPSLRVSITP